MMKKFILPLLTILLILVIGCKPKETHVQAVSDSFDVPEVAAVVLYQVNPRVCAPSNSFK